MSTKDDRCLCVGVRVVREVFSIVLTSAREHSATNEYRRKSAKVRSRVLKVVRQWGVVADELPPSVRKSRRPIPTTPSEFVSGEIGIRWQATS